MREKYEKLLEFTYHNYGQEWFNIQKIMHSLKETPTGSYFTTELKQSETFINMLNAFAEEKYFERRVKEKRKEYRLTGKALNEIGYESYEKDNSFLTYLEFIYKASGGKPFTADNLFKRYKWEPRFISGIKTWDEFIELLVNNGYARKRIQRYAQKDTEYLLTDVAISLVTGEGFAQETPTYTKKELIDIVLGELYMVHGPGRFNDEDYKLLTRPLRAKRGFDESWKAEIGDPGDMGGWLEKKGKYLTYLGKAGKFRLYRINSIKWKPSDELKGEREKRKKR